MTDTKIKYLLGIDGGGTKTEFLLTDLNETPINRIFLGTSNPVNLGIENTKKILMQGISQVCDGYNVAEISAFAGIAGSGSGDIKSEITDFLSSFGFGAYANDSDTKSVLKLALNDENGAAVIMGTGIVAFAQSEGKLRRIGGWGYMIDKGGSGFHLGSDALNCAFGALDGRGGSELILKLVEGKLESKLENSISKIYSGGAAFIASFAPIVFEAYKSGDSFAEEIIDKNIREACILIKAARSFLKDDDKIVICGGLCQQKDILEPFFKKHLGGSVPLYFADEPTVNGAILIAKSNIDGGE